MVVINCAGMILWWYSLRGCYFSLQQHSCRHRWWEERASILWSSRTQFICIACQVRRIFSWFVFIMRHGLVCLLWGRWMSFALNIAYTTTAARALLDISQTTFSYCLMGCSTTKFTQPFVSMASFCRYNNFQSFISFYLLLFCYDIDLCQEH